MLKRITLALGIGFGIIAVAVAVPALLAHAQSQRTTCYDSGNTRICDTFDGMGNITSKSRCYQSGGTTRCDSQSFGSSSSSSTTTVLPIPNTGRKP